MSKNSSRNEDLLSDFICLVSLYDENQLIEPEIALRLYEEAHSMQKSGDLSILNLNGLLTIRSQNGGYEPLLPDDDFQNEEITLAWRRLFSHDEALERDFPKAKNPPVCSMKVT